MLFRSIDSNQFRPAIRHEGSEQEDRVRDPEEKICVLLLRTPSALIPVDFRVAKTGTGGEGETTCGQALIESVFKAHGPGFIKEIRWDRGYLDGPWLAEAEERLGFRWVMGVRENMDLFADALGLSRLPDTVWEEVRPPKFDDPRARPKRSLVRFEALMTWEGYGKPLTAVVIRDVYPDAVRYQVIVTPETRWTADQIHERSRSRWDIEEFFCILTVHWGLGRKLLARRIDIYRALVSLMMLLSALLQLFEASGEERRTLKEYQNAFKLGATHLIVGCGGWFAVLRLHEVNALINRCGGEAGATGAREWGAEQTRIRSP